MTRVDWVALAVIAIAALNGLRRGLVVGALSLAGIAAGAYFGAKLAPQFLSGDASPYTPLVALGGTGLLAVPPLRLLDTRGGLLLGAAAGVAIVWIGGAIALHFPGQRELREEVQASRILGEINERVPPTRLLDAIARVDPFLSVPGP